MMASVSTEAEPPRADPGYPGAPLTLYLVKRLEMVIRALLDDALRPLGLTTLQYTALSVLRSRGALSSAQLARRSFLRPQTMHEMVLTLEKRGLITRTPAPGNRRILLASLTETGHALMTECVPAVRELENRMLIGLSPQRQAEFRGVLQHGISSLAAIAVTRRIAVGGRD
ncbi:MarR family winged helix-turn-helix transcriptional regulator [Saccharothrix coeruleofusca]|uniref:MarR family winged helix-turn-helix transcriptional regulator n=1 Tax=Saccharothrix coeruleofusca TaxID=33919 RepID=UPI001AE65C8E|nr:MarR family transcriptional regulator [Saccharothrix coeruleofusca]